MNREVHVPFCERLEGKFLRSTHLTAIPELLNMLDIKGKIITTDAMGCQKDIADKIQKQGGDYLFSVKGHKERINKAFE